MVNKAGNLPPCPHLQDVRSIARSTFIRSRAGTARGWTRRSGRQFPARCSPARSSYNRLEVTTSGLCPNVNWNSANSRGISCASKHHTICYSSFPLCLYLAICLLSCSSVYVYRYTLPNVITSNSDRYMKKRKYFSRLSVPTLTDTRH